MCEKNVKKTCIVYYYYFIWIVKVGVFCDTDPSYRHILWYGPILMIKDVSVSQNTPRGWVHITKYTYFTVRCAHGSDQLFPTLLKYVNYEGSWCIETELLFKKMPPYYSSLVIFKKNFFLFQFAKFVKFWKGTSWVRTSSHIGYCNFLSKYNCLVF